MAVGVTDDLRGKTVVITGGSAGVGLATAREFARRGANVALLARDRSALEGAKAEIESLGGRVSIHSVDVADADAVFAAARACEEELGPVDVWVNNAMATVFGRVTELTPEEIRRVTEVTYLGSVHGTMAALRHMQERDRGVIVQVGSSLAYRGIPLQAAYCAAKHAIRGFTDSLRTELLHAGSGIQVTTVHLPAINTPQFDWARTKRRKAPRPVAPIYGTKAAAKAVVHAARHPVREHWLGTSTAMTILGNMVAPQVMDRILARHAVKGQDRDEDVRPDRPDNLFEPVPGVHRAEGSFGGEARRSALLLPAPAFRMGAALGAGLAVAAAGVTLGVALASILPQAERPRRHLRR